MKLRTGILLTVTVGLLTLAGGSGSASAALITYGYDGAGRLVGVGYGSTNSSHLYDHSGSLRHISTFATAGADLAITQSSAPDSPTLGAPFYVILTVANLGPSSATGVQLTDTLPAGLNYLAATASQGSCAFNGGALTCTIGTLGVGATATIRLQVRATVSGPFTHTATVSSTTADPVPANNTMAFSFTVHGPPALVLLPGGPGSSGVEIVWSALAEGFILEETTSLRPPVVWTPSASPSLFGGALQTPATLSVTNRFYRLRLP